MRLLSLLLSGLAILESVHVGPACFDDLAAWVVREGGHVGSIKVETRGGLRGLFTTDAVAAGEPLLAVPRHCTLWAAQADGLKAHENLMQRLLESEAAGTLPLLRALLPQTVPLLRDWCELELEQLQSAHTQRAVVEQLGWLQRTCERVRSTWTHDSPVPSLDAYRWAESIVRSRSLAATNAEGEAIIIIVPIFDLCNHRMPPAERPPETGDSTLGGAADAGVTPSVGAGGEGAASRASPVIITSDEMVVLCARTALERGEEVHIDYGRDDGNARLLLDYGFAELHESELAPCGDILHLDLSTDTRADQTCAATSGDERSRSEDGMTVTVGSAQTDAEALRAVRAWLAARPRTASNDAPEAGPVDEAAAPKSEVEEETLAEMFRCACARALTAAPTGEADDRAELEGLQREIERLGTMSEPAFRKVMALHFRIGQKSALRHTMASLASLGSEGGPMTVLEALRLARGG